MNNFNFSKMRCKKLAWMLEGWPEWLYLVDAFSNLNPRVPVGAPFFIRCSLCHALGHWTRSQGPPSFIVSLNSIHSILWSKNLLNYYSHLLSNRVREGTIEHGCKNKKHRRGEQYSSKAFSRNKNAR